MYADSYRIWSCPNPASHSTFISRMNDQGLAVTFHHKSAVLPTRSPGACRQRQRICTLLDLRRRHSYGIPYEYYPHNIDYSMCFFVSSDWFWRPGTLYYSYCQVDTSYFELVSTLVLYKDQSFSSLYKRSFIKVCFSSCNVILDLCIARNLNLTIRFVLRFSRLMRLPY